MARLIDAYGEHRLVAADNTDCELIFANETIGVYDNRGEIIAEFDPDDIPKVDAVPVVQGNWNIRCEAHRDNHTGEVDEDFYLECSECHRKVWDVSQSDVLLGRYGKICNDDPYCHCGAKMDGGAEDG